MASLHLSSSSPIFDSTKNGSIDYMKKIPEGFRSGLFSGPFPDTALPDGRRLRFYEVVSEARDLSTSVKTKFNDFVDTVKDEQQIEDVSKEQLEDFTTSLRRSTDQSLEQFSRKVSGLLTEFNCQSQELERELDKAKASGKLCGSLLSVIVGVCVALVRPLAGGLAAVPILPCFGLFWNLVMERPIEEKLNDLRAITFKTHSAILEAGKIKDAVYGVSNFFTDSPPPYAQKVYVNFKDEIDKDQLLRYMPLARAKNYSDFKAKGLLDEEGFKFQGSTTSVSNSSSAFKEKGTIAGTSILLSSVMANDFKMKKAMEEEVASFHLVPFSDEVGDDGTTTKRLWELGKEIMAAAIAQMEMIEHDIFLITHSVKSSLQEV